MLSVVALASPVRVRSHWSQSFLASCHQHGLSLLAGCCLLVASRTSAADGAQGLPKTQSAAFESAALAWAEGRAAEAVASWKNWIQDSQQPVAVRALSYAGLTRAVRQTDGETAAEGWRRRVAEDASLPRNWREQLAAPPYAVGDHRAKLPEQPKPAAVFYVAPTGADTQEGTEARPFATLERARQAVREFKKAQGGRVPAGGISVILAPGEYPRRTAFRLAAEDSGEPGAPVVYRAAQAGTVRLTGGVRLASWARVSDPDLRKRLAPGASDAVWMVDLRQAGVTNFGDATALRRAPQLFCQGVPQTLARWPNEGFVKTGEVQGTNLFKEWGIEGCRDGRFRFVEDRPATWREEADIRLYGYWFWDWYEEFQRVAALDADGRSFRLAEPYSVYGYRKGQRYYALNVLRELDQPGEWYLDRAAGWLFWMPPDKVDPRRAEVWFSVAEEPLVDAHQVSNLWVLGLTLGEARGDGLVLEQGSDCLVAGCTMQRLGGDAIVVQGGRHCGVFGCRMHTLGCGGVRMLGGDRATLTRGDHFVENCRVADISLLKRTYTPAVHLDGCGNRIAHNLFERMPSSAMRIEGNDQLIELNQVRQVVQESDDQGGVDMFGNPLYRGVVIRWNHWADIGGGTHNGAAGVRLDDMISGVLIHGNVFERCGAVIFGGVQIHGGKDNCVDGNVFLDCFAGISFSRWGAKRWEEAVKRFLPEAAKDPYPARYPELARLTEQPDVNDVCRNMFIRCGQVALRDGGVPRWTLNTVSGEAFPLETLADPARWKAETRVQALLMDPIPFRDIGPYPHPWRAE